MHLVIPTHLSLFWMVCHLSRKFSLKEFEQEPQNRLPPSPHCQTIPFLTSDPWPTTLVLAGYKLVVLNFHVCPRLACCSCVCHDLKACLYILLLVLDLLWCECFPEPSFFMSYFFHGLGLAWLWLIPSLIHSLPLSWIYWHFCYAILSFLLCYCLTRACWASFGPAVCLIPVAQYCHWANIHAIFGLPWPIPLLSGSLDPSQPLGILGPFPFLEHSRPVSFSWASLAHSNSLLPWAFAKSFGLP